MEGSMRRLLTPEPHRSEIVRRLSALPERPDATGAVLIWMVVMLLAWVAVVALVAFLFWLRAAA
jgi:hypothetical protein